MKKIIFSLVLYNNSLEDVFPLLNSINELSKLCLDRNENKIFLSINDNSLDSNIFRNSDLKFLNFQWQYTHNLRNVGFGLANNFNFQKFDVNDQDIFIVSNPDTYFEANKLIKLIDYFQNQSEIVCVNPLIKNEKKVIQFTAKKDPTFLSLLIGFLPIFLKIPFLNKYDYFHKNKNFDYNKQIIKSTYLSGCFLIIKAKIFKKVGGFSSEFFLHLEDADLTRKCSRYGLTAHLPFAEIIHLWNRGSHKSIFQIFQVIRSMFIYFHKWQFKIF